VGEAKSLYDILRAPPSSAPAELRLVFKLRELELRAEGAPKAAFSAAERAFNILGHPELRTCYENLLANPRHRRCFRTAVLERSLRWATAQVTVKPSSSETLCLSFPSTGNGASGPCASLSSTATAHYIGRAPKT